jgi:hypothetical protein
MTVLTPVECRIRRTLVERVRNAEAGRPEDACLTYSELGIAIDPDGDDRGMSRPPFRTMFPALGHVSMYEVEHGRPMLSALVVSQNGREPGPGFAELARQRKILVGGDDVAFWHAELERVVLFWTADDPTVALDAVVDRLLRELVSLKAAVRHLAAS